MERTLDLLTLDGWNGFIVPSMWLTLEHNEKLRRLTLSCAEFSVLVDTGRAFRDAVVETVIPIIVKRKHLALQSHQWVHNISVTATCSVRLLDKSVSISERLKMLAIGEWKEVFQRDQIEWWENQYARFDYYLSKTTRDLIKRLQDSSKPISEIGEVVQGLTAYDRYQGQSEEIIVSRAYHSDFKQDDTFEKYLQGRDVDRYSVSWSGEYISYGPWLAAPRDPKYFHGPRLLFREVTGGEDRPIGTFTHEDLYYGHSVIPVIIGHNFHLLYVLTCSNSKLLAWYNLHTSPNARKGAFPKMNPSDVASLPIFHFIFKTTSDRRARLQEKGQKLYGRYCQKNDLACVTGFVEHELAQDRSDIVHDLLAFLAQEMIDMNKEKQGVTENFWLDLEGVSDPDIYDILRSKGKWEATLWKSEACRPFVNQESRSTRHLDDSLGWNEEAFKAFVKALVRTVPNLSALVHVYRTHHLRYYELAGRISKTDYLIDQIVYQLYGLTEEEIAIVEGEA